MLERFRAAREKDEGFTLIELLIVIIILGILAAIVLFGLGTFRKDSKTAACKADRRNVETAVAAYNAKHDSYPVGAVDGSSALVTEGYLDSAPTSASFAVVAGGGVTPAT